MKTNHKIIIGDAQEDIKTLKDESAHLIITSPPYWQIKDYRIENQIGYNDTYEEYINKLNNVWKECYRVLHKGCRMCINIGDQFLRAIHYGRYRVIPIREDIIRYCCKDLKMDYLGAIIWQKRTTCNTTGGASVMGSYPNPRNGIISIDYEFILIFKKLGNAPTVPKSLKGKSRLTEKEWAEYFQGHWKFVGEKQNGHVAMFPEELPKRLIKMFSFIDDTILDPFLGSGTTVLAARKLGRNSIGIEINPKFLSIIKEKVGITQKNLLDDAEFEIIKTSEK